MAGFDQEGNPVSDYLTGSSPDTSSYRFVPSGTQRYDSQGRPEGSYYAANMNPQNLDPMGGISIDDFMKQGLKGESPWTGKANNSSLSDLAEVTKGFITDTGGAGPMILGAGLGGYFGGAASTGGELASGAATGAGALPEWAGGAAGNGAMLTGGEGLGAASVAGAGLTTADAVGTGFAAGGGAFGGAGVDAFNPFSFDQGLPNPFDASGSGSGGSLPNGGGTQSFSPLNSNYADWMTPQTPTTGGTPDWAQSALNDGAVTSGTAAPSGFNLQQYVSKYGLDAGKAVLNYLQNQGLSKQTQQAGQQVNPLNDPRRQPFINQATQNVTDPNAFLNNPRGQAIMAQLNAQRQADYGKHGYGGTDLSKWDVATASAMSDFLNKEQASLLPYTGFDQNNQVTQYMAQRDSLAFKTQSYQGFTALAAKIGMESGAGKAVTDAATELGKSILKYFS